MGILFSLQFWEHFFLGIQRNFQSWGHIIFLESKEISSSPPYDYISNIHLTPKTSEGHKILWFVFFYDLNVLILFHLYSY